MPFCQKKSGLFIFVISRKIVFKTPLFGNFQLKFDFSNLKILTQNSTHISNILSAKKTFFYRKLSDLSPKYFGLYCGKLCTFVKQMKHLATPVEV